MENLIISLGQLMALKRFNRDKLASELGLSRPNMLAAFSGRRPMPSRYMVRLRSCLGLDEEYYLLRNITHAFTVTDGEKQAEMVDFVLRRFAEQPFARKCVLLSVGEMGVNGKALVLEDAGGRLLCVRNDDMLLYSGGKGADGQKAIWARLAEWFDFKNCPEFELPQADFEQLFDPHQSPVTPEALSSFLNQPDPVWTWARIKEKAAECGMSTAEVARKLGFGTKQ